MIMRMNSNVRRIRRIERKLCVCFKFENAFAFECWFWCVPCDKSRSQNVQFEIEIEMKWKKKTRIERITKDDALTWMEQRRYIQMINKILAHFWCHDTKFGYNYGYGNANHHPFSALSHVLWLSLCAMFVTFGALCNSVHTLNGEY